MSTIRTLTIGLAALLGVVWAAFTTAAENHRQYVDAKKEECTECHRGSGVMPNHDAFFLREHRVLAKRVPNNCSDCHQQSWCSDCHFGGNVERRFGSSLSRRGENMPETHAADFLSTHPIKAHDDPQSCARCHEKQTFCSDCHQRQITGNRASMAIKPHAPTFAAPGVPDPAWVSFHKGEARRNLMTCEGCHPSKQDCSNFACHPGLGGR
jgi:hypothetical protein